MPFLFALAIAAAEPAGAAAAERLLAAYRAAWAKADSAALAALYAPDAELLSVAAAADGTKQIRQLYAAAFAGGMDSTLLTTRLDGLHMVAPGVGAGRGGWRIAPRKDGAEPYCGRFFTVLRQTKAGWRIASFAEVQLACSAVWP